MRAATKQDADAIALLEMQLFPDNCMNETTVRNEIEAGSSHVIYDGPQLVGYTIVRQDRDIADLLRIGVRDDQQSRGYGSRLLKLTFATNLPRPLMLTVRKSNTRAIQLYRWAGFEVIGQLEAYGEKSWVMLLTSWSM